MKNVLSLIAAVVSLSLLAGSAQAIDKGLARLSWTNCDPIVQNLNFTAPGQLADLVLSSTNSSDAHRGFRFQIRIGPNVPDAWRFDAAGCNVGQTALNTAALNKSCPAFQGANPLPISNYGYELDAPGTATLDILNAYDSVPSTVPSTRYTVFKYTFNHAFSNTGPRDPAQECGFAEQEICFWIQFTEWLNPDLSSDTFGIETNFVTWQDDASGVPCPTIQTNESTWGRVKGLYR